MTTKYDWSGSRAPALAAERLAAELVSILPEVAGLPADARRDAALAEILNRLTTIMTGQINLEGTDPLGKGIGDIDIVGASTNQQSRRANLRLVAFKMASILDTFVALANGDVLGSIQWVPDFSQTSCQIKAEQVDSTGPFLTARIVFEINRTAAGGAVAALTLEPSATAGDTLLLVYDVSAAAQKRVTVGAADSGGAGFKLLRVPN
jgi:hypothetical protein